LIQKEQNIDELLSEIEELKNQLFEANSIIDAIKEGSVDALIINDNGRPNLYSLETADYTYRVLIEKFGEGALSISETGIILYCNEYFANLINIPADKIIGTYFNSYVDSVGQYKVLYDNLTLGLSKGEIVLNVNGVKIPVYASLTNLQPTLPAIGIIITDLSEKRKHEEELALNHKNLELKVEELSQINNRMGQFIHVISHDVKEPIRKIITYASHLISDNSKFENKKEHSLKVINNSAIRLNSLVDDLVKYALTADAIIFEEVDLNIIVSEVIEDLELIIKENNADVFFEHLPKIYGSKVQMRQLFSNILINALKYKKEKLNPEIKIISKTATCSNKKNLDTNFHKISIVDNGIGIEEKYLQKIFDIFQRLHMPGEYSGNGVGLAVCKKIMDNHSGKIEATSINHDGTTFTLYFPTKNVQ